MDETQQRKRLKRMSVVKESEEEDEDVTKDPGSNHELVDVGDEAGRRQLRGKKSKVIKTDNRRKTGGKCQMSLRKSRSKSVKIPLSSKKSPQSCADVKCAQKAGDDAKAHTSENNSKAPESRKRKSSETSLDNDNKNDECSCVKTLTGLGDKSKSQNSNRSARNIYRRVDKEILWRYLNDTLKYRNNGFPEIPANSEGADKEKANAGPELEPEPGPGSGAGTGAEKAISGPETPGAPEASKAPDGAECPQMTAEAPQAQPDDANLIEVVDECESPLPKPQMSKKPGRKTNRKSNLISLINKNVMKKGRGQRLRPNLMNLYKGCKKQGNK